LFLRLVRQPIVAIANAAAAALLQKNLGSGPASLSQTAETPLSVCAPRNPIMGRGVCTRAEAKQIVRQSLNNRFSGLEFGFGSCSAARDVMGTPHRFAAVSQ
jgi:hypothetical protein